MSTQDTLKDKIGKTISVLKTELNTVRAGRANAALLDQIVVPYWGVDTPLRQLANISVPDPRTLMIAPFDPKCIADIEKAMQEGYSTAPDQIRSLGFGAGMGLPNMKRYTDDMKIDSVVGQGTTVTMT
ncbi:MAG: ribosome recycling factor, partial [Firmicutes bacterium]|nr:ribosome recycling factor [Bacillota bacterium]